MKEMLENLESLCNDFSNVNQLLGIMEKGAWEYANIVVYNDDDKAKADAVSFLRGISYALAFVSDALEGKVDSLWEFRENINKKYRNSLGEGAKRE